MTDEPEKAAKFYIGLHTHRHGTSTFLFQVTQEMGLDDFIGFLGDEYEQDRDDEFLELTEQEPIKVPNLG